MSVVHAYRWPLADQAMGCCDFYLPQANLHIECWQLSEEAASIVKIHESITIKNNS